jgi:DNA repair exonuclease SbcCD ATPase subunit
MKARPKIEDYKYSDGSGYDDLRHHADIEQWAEEAEQENKELKKELEYEIKMRTDAIGDRVRLVKENKELTINLRSKSDTLEADAIVIRNRDKQIKELRGRLERWNKASKNEETALKQENKELREALEEYGAHQGGCPKDDDEHHPLSCTCGLEQALKI